MKYLFICGCPRSGTTALWDLIAAHEKVAMGVERFMSKINPEFQLTPSLFNKERFFNVQPGDSHYKELHPAEYYQDVASRWNQCKIVGDKIPTLFVRYPELYEAFPSARILFIYRNIFDVANSFMERKKNPNDSWSRDYQAAVKLWNTSLGATLKCIRKGYPILCLEYETLFFGDYKLQDLLGFMDVETTNEFESKFRELRQVAQDKDDERVVKLTTNQKHYISKNANFNLYKRLIEATSQPVNQL